MIEWLKTTIPGIVLLGAVGSLVAVGLLKGAVWAIRRFVRPAADSLFGRVFVLLRSPHYVIKYLRSSPGNTRELIVTCTALLSTFIMICTGILLGVTMVIAGVATTAIVPGNGIGRELIFQGSLLFFPSVFLAFSVLSSIWQVYDIYMSKADQNAETKAREEFHQRRAPS